jgi:RNA recognition motif-containing protein
MFTRLFVGNINYEATEADLRELFIESGYLPVKLTICSDRDTGKRKGYAFVELQDVEPAKVIEDLNGAALMGRRLVVNPAHDKPRTQR